MTKYVPPKDLQWVNHGNAVLAVNEEGKAFLLEEDEAALWRFLNQSYGVEEIRSLFSALLNISETEGSARLEEVIHSWLEEGLVEIQCG